MGAWSSASLMPAICWSIAVTSSAGAAKRARTEGARCRVYWRCKACSAVIACATRWYASSRSTALSASRVAP